MSTETGEIQIQIQAGSSKVNPARLDSFLEALDEAGIPYDFARGYDKDSAAPDEALIAEAAKLAASYDQVVLFVGLTELYESEGYDRETMALPEANDLLAEAVLAANPATAVVLQCGGPVELPWRDRAGAILLTYLSGCQGGKATLRLLTGAVSPSGKLAESWPERYGDVSCADTFGTADEHIEYRESIYVGYRYYDAAEKPVAYPFGHGLSYIEFAYRDLRIEGRTVRLTVANVGDRIGAETVQLYLGKPDSTVYRAPRELKAWEKLRLVPGESAEVAFTLSDDDLAVYVDGWKVERGTYTVMVGSSSRDIWLTGEMDARSGVALPEIGYPAGAFTREGFERLLGAPVPGPAPAKPFTINTLLGQTASTLIGKIVLKFSIIEAAKEMGGDKQAQKMAEAMMGDMPIRAMGMGGGNRGMIHGLTDILNGHLIRGLGRIIKG